MDDIPGISCNASTWLDAAKYGKAVALRDEVKSVANKSTTSTDQ
jgi:hypothetical protein